MEEFSPMDSDTQHGYGLREFSQPRNTAKKSKAQETSEVGT